MSNKQYYLIVLIFVVATLASFYSGFFLKNTLLNEANTLSRQNNTTQKFRPNFIDEAILITKDLPRRALVLSAIRTHSEPKNNYTLKVFYFDGKKWNKKITEGKTTELDKIPTVDPIVSWKIEDDPSYMLLQKISGEISLDETNLGFSFPKITNEIPIRSNYKYTRFMSEAQSKITINNQEFETHGLYTRTYSFNPPESLIFTNNPAGITTEWLAFWDKNGNFYSIDESIVDDKITNNIYKAHSMGIKKDSLGNILNTFDINLSEHGANYIVNINGNINQSISINKLDSVNKSITGDDRWNIGLVEGKLLNRPDVYGIGLFESISQ